MRNRPDDLAAARLFAEALELLRKERAERAAPRSRRSRSHSAAPLLRPLRGQRAEQPCLETITAREFNAMWGSNQAKDARLEREKHDRWRRRLEIDGHDEED